MIELIFPTEQGELLRYVIFLFGSDFYISVDFSNQAYHGRKELKPEEILFEQSGSACDCRFERYRGDNEHLYRLSGQPCKPRFWCSFRCRAVCLRFAYLLVHSGGRANPQAGCRYRCGPVEGGNRAAYRQHPRGRYNSGFSGSGAAG